MAGTMADAARPMCHLKRLLSFAIGTVVNWCNRLKCGGHMHLRNATFPENT